MITIISDVCYDKKFKTIKAQIRNKLNIYSAPNGMILKMN